ncbi:MAG: hypothetical protein IK083_03380 [Abditibacteriota bacterium]|nr:hypothetical protein [Abditibacteriota bacterium]
MTSKELIKRVIEFDRPERIGLDFPLIHKTDMQGAGAYRPVHPRPELAPWGRHPELVQLFPDFDGELMQNANGDIYGRLNGKTKGECLKGGLENSLWEDIASFEMPALDRSYFDEVEQTARRSDKFFLVGCNGFFAGTYNFRRLENYLMDILLEKDKVLTLLDKLFSYYSEILSCWKGRGVDAVCFADDLGTQERMLLNPRLWREVFKPLYTAFARQCHRQDMKMLLHSCGWVYDIIGDLIEAGVDVFQFDQPQLAGTERLDKEFGGRCTFWSPVDIQKILVTGDRDKIEAEARLMLRTFGSHGGGLIAKDYPTLDDIGVRDEWADWARHIFIEEGVYS